jgi:carbon monoxide dehydrogenase subunit G
MKRVERSARIDAPPEEVFAYLADLGNVGQWQTGIVSAELTSAGAIGAGSTALVVRDLMGQRVEAPLTVTGYEPPRRLEITSEVSGVKVKAELDLGAADAATTDVRFAMEIRGSFITSFMEPMIAGAAGGEIDASLERIRARFADRG